MTTPAKRQRAELALELTNMLGDGRAGSPECACDECVEKRREFSRKLLTELLVPLMADGGL